MGDARSVKSMTVSLVRVAIERYMHRPVACVQAREEHRCFWRICPWQPGKRS